MAENTDSARNCLHLQDVQMKRKDYELSAAASLASRVIERARQMLANKQILMEDKKAEVITECPIQPARTSCMLNRWLIGGSP